MVKQMECLRRKLQALKYPQIEDFNPNDETILKNFILWIEDQHIRFYKIEDRDHLRNNTSPTWAMGLNKYLQDLNCPFDSTDMLPMLDWLMGHAIRLEYNEEAQKYNAAPYPAAHGVKSENTISGIYALSVNDPEFKTGVTALAKILQIPLHEDYFVTLTAVKKFVESRMTKEAVEIASTVANKKVSSTPLNETELGFDLKDPELNKAACALRLLYITDLRTFQTKINEAIVAVQNITANPKTDQKLGRVGR